MNHWCFAGTWQETCQYQLSSTDCILFLISRAVVFKIKESNSTANCISQVCTQEEKPQTLLLEKSGVFLQSKASLFILLWHSGVR